MDIHVDEPYEESMAMNNRSPTRMYKNSGRVCHLGESDTVSHTADSLSSSDIVILNTTDHFLTSHLHNIVGEPPAHNA